MWKTNKCTRRRKECNNKKHEGGKRHTDKKTIKAYVQPKYIHFHNLAYLVTGQVILCEDDLNSKFFAPGAYVGDKKSKK